MGTPEWSRCNAVGQRIDEIEGVRNVAGCAHVLFGAGSLMLPTPYRGAPTRCFSARINDVAYPTLALLFAGKRRILEHTHNPIQFRDEAWFSRAIGSACRRYVVIGGSETTYANAQLLSLDPREVQNGYCNVQYGTPDEDARYMAPVGTGRRVSTTIHPSLAAHLTVGPGDANGLQVGLVGAEDAVVIGVHKV